MKILAFAQTYNESRNGNLDRWLKNLQPVVDEFVIYDDGSTDDTYDKLQKAGISHQNIIRAEFNDFRNEIIHKQMLLDKALTLKPDWILWVDVDTVLDGRLTYDELHRLLGEVEKMDNGKYGGIAVGHLNLWRSPAWERTDDGYGGDTITPTTIWRNTGKLHFPYGGGLHNPQYPQGMGPVLDLWNLKLLHYGFASKESIIRKYLTYKANGQRGRALERLIDEQHMVLEPVPMELFPAFCRPEPEDKPEPISYDQIRFFDTYDDYLKAKEAGDL